MKKNRRFHKIVLFMLSLLCMILPLSGCSDVLSEAFNESTSYETASSQAIPDTYEDTQDITRANKKTSGIDETDGYLDPDGSYTTKEDVSNYLIQYKSLPDNFITKKDAKKLGWNGGSLESYAPGKCIGGDHFGNYEGVLPDVAGRTYHECDIDTLGAKSRGAKRIIYSDDGQLYYTSDHYETFTLLYGDDDYQ